MLAGYHGKHEELDVWFTSGGIRRRLALRLDLRNHSPTGFGWGYGGSGPSQLALAMLADAVGDDLALRHYQTFKWRVIAPLDLYQDFFLSHDRVVAFVEEAKRVPA